MVDTVWLLWVCGAQEITKKVEKLVNEYGLAKLLETHEVLNEQTPLNYDQMLICRQSIRKTIQKECADVDAKLENGLIASVLGNLPKQWGAWGAYLVDSSRGIPSLQDPSHSALSDIHLW